VPTAVAGQPWQLDLNFYDEESGTLTDPASVQLDITYGEQVGFVPDVAGPYAYSGASTSTPGQVWRIGTGQYAFIWQIPPSTQQGVYVANWTCVYGSDTLLAVENFPVTGGYTPPVPAGDLGYWTGSLAYTPSAGTPAVPVTVVFGAVDGNGIAWLWQKLEGWDGPDVQGAGVIPRSGDHGAWAAPQYYAARTMTWTITASAPTQALRDLARATLQQAVPVSDLAVLTYNEPAPKQAMVRRSGKITEAYPTLADVTFTVGLVAPDPRKYSTQQKTLLVNAANPVPIGITVPFTMPVTLTAQGVTGSGQVTNAGTFETRPVIVITGPTTSPALINVTTGQTVSWTGLVVPAGATLTADFNIQQATLSTTGGTLGAYRAADAFSSWWTLPPGTSTIQLGGQLDAGASMVIAWQDAWVLCMNGGPGGVNDKPRILPLA